MFIVNITDDRQVAFYLPNKDWWMDRGDWCAWACNDQVQIHKRGEPEFCLVVVWCWPPMSGRDPVPAALSVEDAAMIADQLNELTFSVTPEQVNEIVGSSLKAWEAKEAGHVAL